MRTREAAADVIGGIYEAALEPARWPEALGRMAAHAEAESAAAIVVDLSAAAVGFMAVAGADPRALDDYAAHYARLDPWSAFLGGRPAGRAIVSQTVMDDAAFERTEFYSDFLRRYGLFHAMGGFVVRSGSLAFLAGVLRARDRGGFQPTQLARLKALFPHLGRAARIHRQLAQAGGIAAGLTTALDRVPLAAVLSDRTGRVVWMNQLAEALVRRGEGLRVRQGRLEAAVANGTTAELRRLIAAAAIIGLHTPRRRLPGVGASAADGNGDDGAIDVNNAGGVLLLPRPWPLKPLTVMVTPMSEPAQPLDIALDLPRPEALLLVSDPERAVQLPTDRLTHAFGLTAAEAKLAAALATGSSLTAYAETAQITIGTARWYLKQALAKTGAHRQSELVRHVITTVGAIGAGAGVEAR